MESRMDNIARVRNPRRHQSGVGLIEVLVAMVVLAFGLLGVAALQATALRSSQSALDHSQAAIQTYAMMDRLRADPASARIGAYNLVNMTCDLPDAGGLPENQRRQWIQDLQDNLGPDACGQVICNAINCTVRVRWNASRGHGGDVDGDADDNMLLESVTVL
jgi:type IV pilus assembly protein PilV